VVNIATIMMIIMVSEVHEVSRFLLLEKRQAAYLHSISSGTS
jgi:hypothetical protein